MQCNVCHKEGCLFLPLTIQPCAALQSIAQTFVILLGQEQWSGLKILKKSRFIHSQQGSEVASPNIKQPNLSVGNRFIRKQALLWEGWSGHWSCQFAILEPVLMATDFLAKMPPINPRILSKKWATNIKQTLTGYDFLWPTLWCMTSPLHI